MNAHDQVPALLHWHAEDGARDAVVIVGMDAGTAGCQQCGAPAVLGAGYYGTGNSDMPSHRAAFEGSFYGCGLRHLMQTIEERQGDLFPSVASAL